MTTFQAIVYGIIHGFTQFLPLSADAHQAFVAFILGWSAPEGHLAGGLALGGFLALLIYFRHDWAAMLSSLLQVIIFRKRPMTLDERLPLFIGVSAIPITVASYYLREPIANIAWTPVLLAGVFALFGFPLWFWESFSRKNKGMSDWNWLDAAVVGLGQALLLIPGCGLAVGSLIAGLARNYNTEAAAKFAFYAATPVLAASAISGLRGLDFQAAMPMHDVSWLTFGVATVVTLFAGLLGIGGFMKNVQQKGFGRILAYRIALAIAVAAIVWVRSR